MKQDPLYFIMRTSHFNHHTIETSYTFLGERAQRSAAISNQRTLGHSLLHFVVTRDKMKKTKVGSYTEKETLRWVRNANQKNAPGIALDTIVREYWGFGVMGNCISLST